MNRTALSIVIALMLISGAIAGGQTLDEFKQNPTPENFQQLSEADQANFLRETYREDLAEQFYQTASNVGKNPGVDQQYFSQIENIGKNSEADDAFFSGGNVFETGRANIAANKASASKYFTAKYSTTYTIEQVEDDFTFDIDLGTLTNGKKTILFSLFKDKPSIKNIRAVAGGFIIEEEQHKTELTGVGNAEVKSYDSETGSVEMVVGDKPLTFTRESGKDLVVEVDNDGGLKLSGAAKGKITRDGKEIRFQNREGALFISVDGKTITADDAIVDSSELYLEGRFSVRGETIKLYSYSGEPSKVVDKKTFLGIESQGQSRDAGEAVTVHLGEINKEGKITGNNAEVWIKADTDSSETFVFAQGKVKVSKYITSPDGTPLAESTVSPRFTGKEASARFDFHSKSEVEDFSLSGQALYEDHFVKIENIQDGSEVLKKQPSPDPQTIDLFEVKCSGCEGGDVTKITKTVIAISQTESTAELSGRTFVSVSAAKGLTVTFKQTADGIVPEPDEEMLGKLGKHLDSGGVLSISKSMLVQTEGDNFFGITPNGIGKYEKEDSIFKLKEDPNSKLRETAIDLNGRQYTGNEIVYVNDDEYDKVSQFISAMEDKDFAKANELGAELSPETKGVLEKELGIKVDLLGNEGYSSHLSTGMAETSGEGKSKVFAEKLRERGVNIDNTGRCVDDACTEAVRKALRSGDAKAHLFLALLNSLDKGKIELLLAQVAALKAEGKSTTEVEEDISRLKRGVQQRSEDKKRFNANYEPKSTTPFFEAMLQASAEVTQTLSEMSEAAVAEQALRIESGEVDLYEKTIIQEAEELKTKKELTEQQLKFHQGRLELAKEQYEKAKKEIQSEASRSSSQYAGTSPVTTEKKLSALEQHFKAEVDKITKDIKQREDNLKEINLKRDELVEQLPDRPDLQAQVYREMGDHAEEAGKRIATVAVLAGAGIQVDQSQANHMLAISLAEAGDEEAAIQVAQESGRPDSEAVVSSIINSRKAAPLVALEADLDSADIRHKWERKIARDELSWWDPILSPASTITDMGGEIRREQAEKDMNFITKYQLEVAAARRAVKKGSEVPKNGFTDSSWFKQMMGEDLTPEERRGALLDQAKLVHHTKGIDAAEPIYRQIVKEAPDSAQAYYAQNQLKMKSLATAVEYSEFAADLVIDIPMAIGASFTAAKLGGKAIKAMKLGETVYKAEKAATLATDLSKAASKAPELAKVAPTADRVAEVSHEIAAAAKENGRLAEVAKSIDQAGAKKYDEVLEIAKSNGFEDAAKVAEESLQAPLKSKSILTKPLGKGAEETAKRSRAVGIIREAVEEKKAENVVKMMEHADELEQSATTLKAVSKAEPELVKVSELSQKVANEAEGAAHAVRQVGKLEAPKIVKSASKLAKAEAKAIAGGKKAVQEAVEDTSKLAKSAQRVDNVVAQGVGKGSTGITPPTDIDAATKWLKDTINAAKKSGDSATLSQTEHYLADPAIQKAFIKAGKEEELLKLQKSLGPKSGLAGAVEKILGKAKPKGVVAEVKVTPIAKKIPVMNKEQKVSRIMQSVDTRLSIRGQLPSAKPFKAKELLWTHNTPIESVEAIFGSGYIRGVDEQGRIIGRGANFRYGLDSEYGEIKFIMRRNFEGKIRQKGVSVEFSDIFAKGDSLYSDRINALKQAGMSEEQALRKLLAEDYDFRRAFGTLSDNEAFFAAREAYRRSYLNPQLNIRGNVLLQDVEVVLVPEHLYDEVVAAAKRTGFDLKKLRKVKGTGAADGYYAYRAKSYGKIKAKNTPQDELDALKKGVRRPKSFFKEKDPVTGKVKEGITGGQSSEITVNPLSFEAEERAYLQVLGEQGLVTEVKVPSPDRVIDDLIQRFPDLETRFKSSPGVWEQDIDTIRKHTSMVFEQYNQQAEHFLPEIAVPEGVNFDQVMEISLALHDIGKPEAIAKGGKHLQRQFTVPILREKMIEKGFTEPEVRIAETLVGNDVLGELAKGTIDSSTAARRIGELANNAGMDVNSYYQLQMLYYVSDAASYPALRTKVFNVGLDGKLVPKGEQFNALESELGRMSASTGAG